MKKTQIAITLGAMCLILTAGICVQVRTTKSTTETVSQTLTENKLRDEVLKWKEKYDNAYKELEQTEYNLEEERKKAVSNNEEAAKVEQDLRNANILLGTVDIKGKGVIVTLDDNKTASIETIGLDPIENYLVHDGDLLQIVNELKNAGAEAIAINEQRIVHTTAITCDGNVVRINGEKVGAPYEIKAIGYPERLQGALERPEGYIKLLKRDGVVVDVKKNNNITIPKYEGIFKVEYMNER